MNWIDGLLLVLAGGVAGFTGGLLGVGGGLIFTPVLFFHYQSLGIPDKHVTALAIGTGLLCTFVVAVSSTAGHWQKQSVDLRVAGYCGLASVVAIVFTTAIITTSSLYTPWIYKIVFSIFLAIVAVRMIRPARVLKAFEMEHEEPEIPEPESRTFDSHASQSRGSPRRFAAYFSGGSLAGFVAALVGVGGGIVLVPLYDRFLGLPIRRAMGTSSATIVFITSVAVIGYMIMGPEMSLTEWSAGYVDFGRALLLSAPAAISARAGVFSAHKTDQRKLRLIFAILALIVALRLMLSAAGIL